MRYLKDIGTLGELCEFDYYYYYFFGEYFPTMCNSGSRKLKTYWVQISEIVTETVTSSGN